MGRCTTGGATHNKLKGDSHYEAKDQRQGNKPERMDASIVNVFPFPGSPFFEDPVHAEVLSSMRRHQLISNPSEK
jgi:energy-coupling factor transporter ATP-binding protein EcfA2